MDPAGNEGHTHKMENNTFQEMVLRDHHQSTPEEIETLDEGLQNQKSHVSGHANSKVRRTSSFMLKSRTQKGGGYLWENRCGALCIALFSI